MLFIDYILYWLKIIRPAVQEFPRSSSNFNVKNRIAPYFLKSKNIDHKRKYINGDFQSDKEGKTVSNTHV